MNIEILYARESLFKSFHDVLSIVAAERVLLEMVGAPLTGEDYVPHLPHRSMEPPYALARVDKTDGGHCEL